ncbi:hypothetical protein MHM84_01100 [Halomonas sp. McH1-25]|uniref:hypothetical protein n=1 Tax=unclassified Halomonas TaxID=2609666 RepID=UPI001EF474A7|nr:MULTISPECIES: hypothetical protein [unclassified Halomonas]MCG7598378.1 hypothetical protein [Halomonas sp. McH1-25]MCP1342680.1 hypothetical protein [Halomonas sp. FL8]MCP1362552.1 hypothetical protein [Halomonas sp. BBD45]MCP1363718.1 hypothetical protein [Halomonas sp. BBD48]
MDRFLSNDSHLLEDRRRKPEGTHLSEVVKVRFTESELDELKAAAALQTGGRLATYVHDLTMESLEANQRRHAQMLAELAEGKPLSDESRAAATQMLQRMLEVGLMRSLHQRQTA